MNLNGSLLFLVVRNILCRMKYSQHCARTVQNKLIIFMDGITPEPTNIRYRALEANLYYNDFLYIVTTPNLLHCEYRQVFL